MDQLMGKFGSYWLGNKANKELNSVGDDINWNLNLEIVTKTTGHSYYSVSDSRESDMKIIQPNLPKTVHIQNVSCF
ncbi:hypothetical protein CTI12_AA471830 [Artemisia annua]|uniref:Uncharacterized protein n=1 Tax=Artemisia annua TaxID=35608 RepID=A0A2U1LNE0_ARTAN|nr:hypothetical protein CTI12_AA471830 [Artemisia annua]